jgi:SpoVK/Ycf46/Vps4 family AAA+-type ATPase
MTELDLLETKHPDKRAAARFADLMGIDSHKQQLLEELLLLVEPKHIATWLKHHHPKGLALAERLAHRSPLVLLEGDVGCGKSALAGSIGTPLAERLHERVIVLETPSNIRGTGLVGELSARITAAFTQAKARVGGGHGLLIIDEGDDLGTQRAQMQAHHEDRAGLNVLIKQIDLLEREGTRLAVILITNRADVLDAALVRRASLTLRFVRPNADARRHLIERLLHGLSPSRREVDELVAASERAGTPFTYSDLVLRVGTAALRRALRENKPISVAAFLDAVRETEPSPLLAIGSEKP